MADTNSEEKSRKHGLIALFVMFVLISGMGICAVDRIEYTAGDRDEIESTAGDRDEIFIPIVKLGIIMIIVLVTIIVGFVGINYLSHPTKWSTKMIDKGRTLEYLTVILIVTIVLILALLGIMEQDSVGAILGAIAGYVLGRAVTPKGEVKEDEGLSPLYIAKKRYAMGEIDKETLNEIKETLNKMKANLD